jgi:oligosaccharyltransferase complex subunit beta
MISILTCLVAAVVAKTPNGANRVLILHDNPAVYVTHSMLFQTLKGTLIINDSSDQNYRYEIKSLTSPNINLMSYGEYNYDHLLIFASSDDELKSFKPKEVTEFFDSGRNVVLLGNVDQNRVFRHLTNAFGVDMDELGS